MINFRTWKLQGRTDYHTDSILCHPFVRPNVPMRESKRARAKRIADRDKLRMRIVAAEREIERLKGYETALLKLHEFFILHDPPRVAIREGRRVRKR